MVSLWASFESWSRCGRVLSRGSLWASFESWPRCGRVLSRGLVVGEF